MIAAWYISIVNGIGVFGPGCSLRPICGVRRCSSLVAFLDSGAEHVGAGKAVTFEEQRLAGIDC